MAALEELYAQVGRYNGSFAERALAVLTIDVAAEGFDSIPASGPVLVVANHPHGIADGLAVLSSVRRVRADVRLLANRVLDRIPELRDECFFVDPFAGAKAAANSRAGLRAAHLWLRGGGALIVFPSGEVAHRPGAADTRDESDWYATAGRLAHHTGARIVPASIDGHNSRLFYTAGAIHPRLRTALLPRELLRQRGSTIRVRFHPALKQAVSNVIAAPIAPARLKQDIASLPQRCTLVEVGSFSVFCAAAPQIPNVLREIGRLREVTYRAAGEGTGRSIDLDVFDEYYLHLFAWDAATQRVVGAYRIGRCDEIVASRGVEALYTRTLFRFDESLLADGPAALELGRSFVRGEYQRHPAALYALWKGIGAFVLRHPHYQRLFGCVSISRQYSDTSQALLREFLKQHHHHPQLAARVEPIHAPIRPAAGLDARTPATIAELERLIRAAESDAKGVPVLLRQYLKLNARLLGFNVDPGFGDALDALMMVELAGVDSRILRPYFGREFSARGLRRRAA